MHDLGDPVGDLAVVAGWDQQDVAAGGAEVPLPDHGDVVEAGVEHRNRPVALRDGRHGEHDGTLLVEKHVGGAVEGVDVG